MKTILFLILSFSVYTLKAQIVYFKDYFPLKSGESKIYSHRWTTDPDTFQMPNPIPVICRSKMIANKEIFFYTANREKDDSSVVGGIYFLNGAFYFDDGKFKFVSAFLDKELENTSPEKFKPLFPDSVQMNKVYYYRSKKVKRTYTFEGLEMLQIKDSSFANCLKLITTLDYNGFHYTSTIWFQKDFGMIKWINGTIGTIWEIKL